MTLQKFKPRGIGHKPKRVQQRKKKVLESSRASILFSSASLRPINFLSSRNVSVDKKYKGIIACLCQKDMPFDTIFKKENWMWFRECYLAYGGLDNKVAYEGAPLYDQELFCKLPPLLYALNHSLCWQNKKNIIGLYIVRMNRLKS